MKLKQKCVSRQYFDSWRGFTKLMHQKKQLRLGEKDRKVNKYKITFISKSC